jgi:hypothetical protein
MLFPYKFPRSSQHQCITRIGTVSCSSLFLPAIVRVLVHIIADLLFLANRAVQASSFISFVWVCGTLEGSTCMSSKSQRNANQSHQGKNNITHLTGERNIHVGNIRIALSWSNQDLMIINLHSRCSKEQIHQ